MYACMLVLKTEKNKNKNFGNSWVNRILIFIQIVWVINLVWEKKGILIYIFLNTSDNLNYKERAISHTNTTTLPCGFKFETTCLKVNAIFY